MLKSMPQILDIVGLSQVEGWRTYLNLFNSHRCSFMKNLRIIKAYYTISFCHWSPLSLTKLKEKSLLKKNLVYIFTRARTFSLHHLVTTTPTLNTPSYRHCWETNYEILLIIENRYCRRNARFPVHSSLHWKFQKCAARVLIRPAQANWRCLSTQE